MSSLRFSVALFAFLALTLTSTSGATGDQGPPSAIQQVRHDLPILLASLADEEHLTPTIDWVVSDGTEAVAMWHAGAHRGVIALRMRDERWWWRAAAVTKYSSKKDLWSQISAPGHDLGSCGSYEAVPPSANDLLIEGFVDEALAKELSSRLPAVPTDKTLEIEVDECNHGPYVVSVTGGYDATFLPKGKDYDGTWFAWTGRSPTEAESASASGSNLLYSFRLATDPNDNPKDMQHLVRSVYSGLFPTPPPVLAFRAGSTLDVWFPYVLPTNTRYSLSMSRYGSTASNVAPEVRDVPGTLSNNVLHFVLPAFELHWGDAMRGEIDGASIQAVTP